MVLGSGVVVVVVVVVVDVVIVNGGVVLFGFGLFDEIGRASCRERV